MVTSAPVNARPATPVGIGSTGAPHGPRGSGFSYTATSSRSVATTDENPAISRTSLSVSMAPARSAPGSALVTRGVLDC
jgi:hypothetical protein